MKKCSVEQQFLLEINKKIVAVQRKRYVKSGFVAFLIMFY
jgi:hypothetical protein